MVHPYSSTSTVASMRILIANVQGVIRRTLSTGTGSNSSGAHDFQGAKQARTGSSTVKVVEK